MKPYDPAAPPAPTPAETALARLDSAHLFMSSAAEALEALGGTAAEKAAQLRGAAAMIQDDWTPELRKEAATDG
jgi:hypothetical protein